MSFLKLKKLEKENEWMGRVHQDTLCDGTFYTRFNRSTGEYQKDPRYKWYLVTVQADGKVHAWGTSLYLQKVKDDHRWILESLAEERNLFDFFYVKASNIKIVRYTFCAE